MAADIHSSPRPSPEVPTLYSLQVLRGLAALMVVAYHYIPYLKDTLPGHDLGALLFSQGYMGVDVFFLISGFIIVHSTARPEHAKPAAFAIRRFFRVVPVAQAATVIYALIIPAWTTWRQVSLSLVFLPQADLDPPHFGFPVVAPEWTLAYELFFYGVFAVALLFTHRHRVALAAGLLLTSIIAAQWSLGGPFALRPEAVYLPPHPAHPLGAALLGELGNPLLAEFIVGMLLAAGYRRYAPALRSGPARRWALGAGTLLLLAFAASFCTEWGAGLGLLNRGAGALALVAGALALEAAYGPPAAAARRWWLVAALELGTLSYAIYLVHAGIAERALRAVVRHTLNHEVGGVLGFLALLPTVLLFAWVLHVWVEQPCIRLGRRLAQAARRPPAPAPA